jgi:hypothetical protein
MTPDFGISADDEEFLAVDVHSGLQRKGKLDRSKGALNMSCGLRQQIYDSVALVSLVVGHE